VKIIAKLAVKGHFVILWETIYVSITFDSLDRLTVTVCVQNVHLNECTLSVALSTLYEAKFAILGS